MLYAVEGRGLPRARRLHPLVRWLPVLGWVLLITYWSGQSDLPIDSPRVSALLLGQQHRLAHAAAFGTLALLVRFALDRTPGAMVWAWLLAAAFGVLDEWHQSFTPGRTPDVEDVLIDAVAAAVAVLVADAFVAGAARPEWTPSRLMAPVALAVVAMPAFFVLLQWHAPAPRVVARRAVAAAERVVPDRYDRYLTRLGRGALSVARQARDEVRSQLR